MMFRMMRSMPRRYSCSCKLHDLFEPFLSLLKKASFASLTVSKAKKNAFEFQTRLLLLVNDVSLFSNKGRQ